MKHLRWVWNVFFSQKKKQNSSDTARCQRGNVEGDVRPNRIMLVLMGLIISLNSSFFSESELIHWTEHGGSVQRPSNLRVQMHRGFLVLSSFNFRPQRGFRGIGVAVVKHAAYETQLAVIYCPPKEEIGWMLKQVIWSSDRTFSSIVLHRGLNDHHT